MMPFNHSRTLTLMTLACSLGLCGVQPEAPPDGPGAPAETPPITLPPTNAERLALANVGLQKVAEAMDGFQAKRDQAMIALQSAEMDLNALKRAQAEFNNATVMYPAIDKLQPVDPADTATITELQTTADTDLTEGLKLCADLAIVVEAVKPSEPAAQPSQPIPLPEVPPLPSAPVQPSQPA